MPCIEGSYTAYLGPLVSIGVVPGGENNPASSGSAPTFQALIDTGAQGTCISPAIVAALRLQPIGMRKIFTALGTQEAVSTYLIDLILTFSSGAPWRYLLPVTELRVDDKHPFQALLGRDVLCLGTFVMSAGGHYTLCL